MGASPVIMLESEVSQPQGVSETESEEEIMVVFEPPPAAEVPDNHRESSFLMALGEEVSNNRNKASGSRSATARPPMVARDAAV